jgi:hypothetical protein
LRRALEGFRESALMSGLGATRWQHDESTWPLSGFAEAPPSNGKTFSKARDRIEGPSLAQLHDRDKG